MRELTAFVSRAYSNYLKPFESQDVLKKCCAESGMSCIKFFLRHISLIRPLGSGGRVRLVSDCTEVTNFFFIIIFIIALKDLITINK